MIYMWEDIDVSLIMENIKNTVLYSEDCLNVVDMVWDYSNTSEIPDIITTEKQINCLELLKKGIRVFNTRLYKNKIAAAINPHYCTGLVRHYGFTCLNSKLKELDQLKDKEVIDNLLEQGCSLWSLTSQTQIRTYDLNDNKSWIFNTAKIYERSHFKGSQFLNPHRHNIQGIDTNLLVPFYDRREQVLAEIIENLEKMLHNSLNDPFMTKHRIELINCNISMAEYMQYYLNREFFMKQLGYTPEVFDFKYDKEVGTLAHIKYKN